MKDGALQDWIKPSALLMDVKFFAKKLCTYLQFLDESVNKYFNLHAKMTYKEGNKKKNGKF